MYSVTLIKYLKMKLIYRTRNAPVCARTNNTSTSERSCTFKLKKQTTCHKIQDYLMVHVNDVISSLYFPNRYMCFKNI